MRSQPLIFTLAVALAGLIGLPASARADNLDRELRESARRVITLLKSKYLKDKFEKENRYGNVGVLKFRVKKGNEPTSDNVGTLNMSLADRLEIALVLANPDEKLGIIQRASEMLANKRRANHLTKDGRQELFNSGYTLAWGGNQQVAADAFLTGLVKISPDLLKTTVCILAVSSNGNGMEKLDEFTVPMDVRTLIESGESFVRKGLVEEGTIKDAEIVKEVVKEVAKVKLDPSSHPVLTKDTPVVLHVFYDDRPVAFTTKDGKTVCPEPLEHQRVYFELENRGKIECGVVLKVNGVNTLFREKLDALACHKWILSPGERIRVVGYQKDGGFSGEFRVLSVEESKQGEIHYGRDVGSISMVVFAGKKGQPPLAKPAPGKPAPEPAPEAFPAPQPNDPNAPPPPEEDELAANQAVRKGEFTAGIKPGSLKALKASLLKNEDGKKLTKLNESKGVIDDSGKTVARGIRKVPFVPEPTPIMSATVVYYRP